MKFAISSGFGGRNSVELLVLICTFILLGNSSGLYIQQCPACSKPCSFSRNLKRDLPLKMKSEKDKMLAGEPYLASGSELVGERLFAKELLYEFNNLKPQEVEARNAILQKLFGKVHNNFHVEPPFRCDYGYNIEIGNNFYANYNLVILDCASVKIGNDVFIAPNVGIYTAGHPIHSLPRNQQLEFALPIEIGNNVWIGGSVVINPGIKIGDNTVIGSGSVVTKDIPSDVIAFGNPCKVFRSITENDKSYYY